MLLAAFLAMVIVAAAPALVQDKPAVVADAKAKTATAGTAKADAGAFYSRAAEKAGLLGNPSALRTKESVRFFHRSRFPRTAVLTRSWYWLTCMLMSL
jgi:hypothetical protein